MTSSTPQVQETNGQLVLEDPVAHAVVRAVEKHNCRILLEAHGERVEYFKRRVVALGRSPEDTVIVLVQVDDVYGGPLAEALMPGHDWQAFRDRGEVPMARGLAGRKGIQAALERFDREAATKLRDMETLGVAVVVVAHGVAEVFG